MTKVAVIGGGAWGTAIASAICRESGDVMIWAREEEVVQAINNSHENSIYLPNITLDKRITATSNISDIGQSEVIFMVVPAQFLGSVCLEMRQNNLSKNAAIVLCSKGIERSSLKMMNEIVEDIIPNDIAILSGPTFAIEVARGLPSSATLAAKHDNVIDKVRYTIENESFKIFPNYDIVGAEIGGAVKNIIAIACGIAEGYGLGESAKAALMVRGVQEMKILCKAKGGKPETLMELCGVGDLILTASSQKSRNFSLGYKLGEGARLEDIMAGRRSVAEGVDSSAAVIELAKKLGIKLPICNAVNRIVHGRADIGDTIKKIIKES